jgi:hypothetical protein
MPIVFLLSENFAKLQLCALTIKLKEVMERNVVQAEFQENRSVYVYNVLLRITRQTDGHNATES